MQGNAGRDREEKHIQSCKCRKYAVQVNVFTIEVNRKVFMNFAVLISVFKILKSKILNVTRVFAYYVHFFYFIYAAAA